MPAAIPLAIAGVGAIGAIASAHAQSNAAKRAAEAQTHAGDSALDYQKSRDAIGDKRIDQRHADYLAYVADWKARHGQGGAVQAAGATAGGLIAPAGMAAAMGQPAPAATTLRGLAGMPAAAPAPVAPIGPPDVSTGSPRTLRDMGQGQWNDWQPYLQGRG